MEYEWNERIAPSLKAWLLTGCCYPKTIFDEMKTPTAQAKDGG